MTTGTVFVGPSAVAVIGAEVWPFELTVKSADRNTLANLRPDPETVISPTSSFAWVVKDTV